MTNREVREWYLNELAKLPAMDEAWQREGLTLRQRAWNNWQYRHDLRLRARTSMPNQEEAALLAERDRRKYGHPEGPGFMQLLTEGRAHGFTFTCGSLGEHASPTRQSTSGSAYHEGEGTSVNTVSHLGTEACWEGTGDPLQPYQARVGGEVWSVRLNDFPDEHLYTLLVDGHESESFDDWPSCWERPQQDGVQPRRPQKADLLDLLSAREYQVFSLLVEGVRTKEIATRLELSPKTVDTYRATLMRKLEVSDRTELLAVAERLRVGRR